MEAVQVGEDWVEEVAVEVAGDGEEEAAVEVVGGGEEEVVEVAVVVVEDGEEVVVVAVEVAGEDGEETATAGAEGRQAGREAGRAEVWSQIIHLQGHSCKKCTSVPPRARFEKTTGSNPKVPLNNLLYWSDCEDINC